MIKLVAIDMDGTLLNSKKELLEETKQYFKDFHKKETETLLVLCTGRPETGIRPYLKDLGYLEENHYIISQNGANIYESRTGKRVMDAFLDSAAIQKWIELGKKHGISVMGAGVDYYYCFDQEPTEWMEFDVKLVSGKLKRIPTEESLNTDFYKILLMGDEEQLNEFETFIPQEWRDEFYVVRSQKYLVEVLTKGVNKAFGLEKLAKELNIQPSEIAAIGDAANDIEMLEYAGLAIAMGNASEEVKAIADIVTDTNENNGVIKAIDKLIQ
jgi:cof-like hydrolase